MTELGARHPRDHHAVRDERCARHRVAVLRIGRLRAPDLFPGGEVERDHLRIERGTVELAVEQRGAAVDDAAADNPCGLRRVFKHRFPDLLTAQRVDGHGLFVVGEIDDPVLDQRLRFLSAIVGHAVGPGRHESFDVVTMDVGKRAIAVLAVAHAISQDIAWRLVVVPQLVSGLRQHEQRNCHTQQQGHDH